VKKQLSPPGAIVLVLTLMLAAFAESSLIAPARAATDPGIVPGSYILVYRDDIVAAADATALTDAEPGVEVTNVYQHALNGFAADLTPAALRRLQSDPRFAQIVPDRKMYPFAQSFTPGANRIDVDLNPYANVNGLDERVDADIAILDMGVGPNADINVVGGYDCTGQSTTFDNGGHGTHVAGIAGAKDNGIGIVGVAPGARIWSIKVLDAFDGNWSWVICGIDWVTAHADVIEVANMSIGETLGAANQVFDGPMHEAIRRSVAAGVTYAVAAGNGAQDAANVIPATYPEVITVSAIGDSDGKPGGLGPAMGSTGDDRFASFSDYGADVDIAAPGVATLSTAPYDGLSTMSGTSFATPHVVGAIALYLAQHGRVGPAAVKAALLATADPGPIPGDPDSYPEGVLNVGRFGGGLISLPANSGKPTSTFTANLQKFPANAQVALAWDGKPFTTVTTSGTGAAAIAVTVPALAGGERLLSARVGTSFAVVPFTIKPGVWLTPKSGFVGVEVKVVLRGYRALEPVSILWKNGARTSQVATATATSSGNATAYFKIPSAFGGAHAVTGSGAGGSTAAATFTVLPRITRSPARGVPGAATKIGMRGFQPGESVQLSLQTSAGTVLLATVAVSSGNGSADTIVTIPLDAVAGPALLFAVGNVGTSVQASFTVDPPVAPASEPTHTATATAEPSPTVESSATPTETPTLEPSATPTESVDPTATPTGTPAESL
jgi:subtilisin